MVGVPGRSKACHNCRQRRIRCGGERPGCHNCAKSNRSCAGYQRNHAFILSKEMVAGQEGLVEDIASPSGDKSSISVHLTRWRVDQKGSSSSAYETLASQPKAHLTLCTVPQQVEPRNAFREQLFSLFFTHAFPKFSRPNIAPAAGNWMLDVLRLPELSPALENATLAVCTARLGKRDSRPVLLQQSLALYTQGLREFSRDVGNASRQQNDQTLAACMVMLMYEVSECPGGTPDAYQHHYNGTMKLLELRGPEAHRSGLSHSIFQSLRVHAMYQSFVQRSVVILSEPEWLSIPFTESKDHFDQLLDILLDVTRFSPQRRRIKEMTDPQLIFHSTLDTIRKGFILEKSLTEWYSSLQETVAGPLYYPELSQRRSAVDSDTLGKLFPVAFQFPHFSICQNLIFYWMALLCVYSHLSWAYDTMSCLTGTLDLIRADLHCTCRSDCLRHFKMDLLQPLGSRLDWPRTIAYDICRSIEYCLQDHERGFGSISILPVLSVVKGHWMYLPGDWTREIAWIDDIFTDLGQERSRIAKFLR